MLLTITIAFNLLSVSAYAPQKGDYFNYSETITVNNGQGSYTGYTDKTQVTGTEQMNSVSGSNISASYTYNAQYSNNQGSSTANSSSGSFTWSSSSFTYIAGTDDQVGYSKPTYVWFAMDPSLPVGGIFYVLNTQFAILSKNYSLQLPTEGNKYVQTIQAQGTGEHQRNDEYGVFNATYTWNAYFDPFTGYIVGYNYLEQDNGQYQGQAGSFTYTDDLYVTATSYPLTPANTLTSGSNSTTSAEANVSANPAGLSPYLVVAVVIIIALGIYAATRRRSKDNALPKHSPYVPPPTSSPTPWESKIDLGSKPSEQVVIRDVAKVKCKYCGTLIPSTAETCPYCGGNMR